MFSSSRKILLLFLSPFDLFLPLKQNFMFSYNWNSICSLEKILHVFISGEGNGNPLQYSCLENPRDKGAWWAAVYGVAKSRTWLSDFHFHFLRRGHCLFSFLPTFFSSTELDPSVGTSKCMSLCHMSVCSSVLCLITTKIWSDGH